MSALIGVYGSAFDPIHFGHIDCLKQIDGNYEHIVVVPSYAHAFGKDMVSFDLRLSAVKTALEGEQFISQIVISDIERDIARKTEGKAVYTFDVLSALADIYGTDDIEFVVGPDNAAPDQWARFHRSEDILNRWGLTSVRQRLKYRSSWVRKMLQSGCSFDTIAEAVPKNVLEDIQQFNLYGVLSNGRELRK